MGESSDPWLDETLAPESSAPARSDLGALTRGAVLGRYVVLARLGAGGMGVVYGAYDPELDRKVAVKVLLPDKHADAAGRARLVREAQALAKLSHPNIVAVHDVGTVDAQVWIAMELVAGTTLTKWLRASVRPWRTVLAVMTAAGRGLAAAHAAGLVHRDFKPDNVMLGDDPLRAYGRVCVMDFGLARASGEQAPADAAATDALESQPRTHSFREVVTREGAIAGTPAYMAPEQFQRTDVDAHADQFAFCVSAWEALHGERPFLGNSVPELASAVASGEIRPPPRNAKAPTWLSAVLRRGLATAPEQRWPSMEALLDALERGQTRARTRRSLAITSGAALAILAPFAVHELDARAKVAACERAGDSIGEVWSAARHDEVQAAMLATAVSHAEPTAARVLARLDAQSDAWRAMRTQVCMEAETQGTWDTELLDRSLWCLEDRRMELEVLVGALAHADADVVHGAVPAAAGLARVDACRDPSALARLPAPPSERREEIRVLRDELSRAATLGAMGNYRAALALASTVRARAASVGWPALWAMAAAEEATMLDRTASYAAAQERATQAHYEASRVGAWDVAVVAATRLVHVVGTERARRDEGLAWGRHAEIALAHASDPDRLLAAGLAAAIGSLHFTDREYARARIDYAHALELKEQALGPDHLDVATILQNLALACLADGDAAQAVAPIERALAIWERELGPQHPSLARGLTALASVRAAMGDQQGARALHERSLAIEEAALGAEHPTIATTLNNLAGSHYRTRDFATAIALQRRSLAILEAHFGSDHPHVASGLTNLAIMHAAAGEHAPTIPLYERALAIAEKLRGPEHDEVADVLHGLAEAHLESGRPDLALPLGERALAIYARDPDEGLDESRARFTVARALLRTHGDLERARVLATQARDGMRSTTSSSELARVEQWLRELDDGD